MNARLRCVYPGPTGGSKHCWRPCFSCRVLVFVCLFVCSVVLPHLRSSRLIIVQPLPLSLLPLPPPPSFLRSSGSVWRRLHTCENLARVPFLFFDVCLEMSFYLVQLTNWYVYKHTHTHEHTERAVQRLLRTLTIPFFFLPRPRWWTPLCPLRIIASALPDPSSAKPMLSFVACKFLALYIC